MLGETYLNDFRLDVILDIIKEIIQTDDSDLVYKINFDKGNDSNAAHLVYIPYLHRLDACYFDVESNPLYQNPNAICRIMPRDEFIKNIKLMES